MAGTGSLPCAWGFPSGRGAARGPRSAGTPLVPTPGLGRMGLAVGITRSGEIRTSRSPPSPPSTSCPSKPRHLEQPYPSKREMFVLCVAGGGWGAPAQQPGLPRYQQCTFRLSRVDKAAFWGETLRSLGRSSCHLNSHGRSGPVRPGNVGAHVLCFQLIFSIVISLNF